jgi:hypothetical protein
MQNATCNIVPDSFESRLYRVNLCTSSCFHIALPSGVTSRLWLTENAPNLARPSPDVRMHTAFCSCFREDTETASRGRGHVVLSMSRPSEVRQGLLPRSFLPNLFTCLTVQGEPAQTLLKDYFRALSSKPTYKEGGRFHSTWTP